jgi:hypothetical protein
MEALFATKTPQKSTTIVSVFCVKDCSITKGEHLARFSIEREKEPIS